MTLEDLKTLIRNGEGIRIEFKEAWDSVPSSFYDTVSSFSNTDGGTLLLGVDDDGQVKGINPASEPKIKKDIITALNSPDLIDPPVSIEPLTIIHPDGLVIVVQIPVSSQVHTYHSRIFLRSFEVDKDITDNQNAVGEMYLRKRNFFSEAQIIPNLSIDDLETKIFDKARVLIRNVRSDHPWLLADNEQMLRESTLWRKDFYSNQEGLTLAAALIFGKDATIQSLLQSYKVEAMVRIKDLDRWDDRINPPLRTNLIDTYLLIKDFLNKHLPEKFYLEGDQRIDLRDKIFREVIGNVIIHREYSSSFSTDIIITGSEVRITNPNKPLFHGLIDPVSFNPYPKNPNIRKFFTALGWADEIGSGIRNTNHYLPFYTPGAKPVFSENDIFTTIIPLLFVSLQSYAQNLRQWLGIRPDSFLHLEIGLSHLSLPVSLKDASWKEVLLYLVPTWYEKGTNLSFLDWPDNHPFANTFAPKKLASLKKGTDLSKVVNDGMGAEGTNLPESDRAVIQSLIRKGEEKVPTWHEKSTDFLHKKVIYIISILSLCSKPISLNELMQFLDYSNRKTFRDNYVSPLRKIGFIELTIPEKLNDPDQKYRLTEAGKAFLTGII